MIIILNDNQKCLEEWKIKLNDCPVKTYEYPQKLINDMLENNENFKNSLYYIIDRFFVGKKDLLKENYIKDLRKICPNPLAKFILASSYYDGGEKVKGFDLVIPRDAMSMAKLRELLNN